MNLFKTTTARLYLSVIFLIVMTLITQKSQAQKEYTTISKNINPEAQELYHDLSPQGDSLYLKSESIFYKVTFLNSLDRKVYAFNPPVLEGKIPLHDIIVGDYTVLVYKKDRIIVFHITRVLEIEKPSDIIIKNDKLINHDIVGIESNLKKVELKGKAHSEVVANIIKFDDEMRAEIKEIKIAAIDDSFSSDQSNMSRKMQSYNITSVDRTNMQSREEYRRNNLRPNGKPY